VPFGQKEPVEKHISSSNTFFGPESARSSISTSRISRRGKFLFDGEEKLYVRGVTYGAFRPDGVGREYQDLEQIERDFACMAVHGINCVRIPHTMPPRSLLDAAMRHGLRVMVGLSGEQYAGYLIDTDKAPDVEAIVRAKVRSVARHPALLCYAIGNEIPAAMARWIGRRHVERYLMRLYLAIKAEDPESLVTYVNYPSTEYLDLSFLDLVAFNVYLESRPRLEAYLYRLQNIAGNRPLLMSEIGLDALRNGEEYQAESVSWQLEAAFRAGCCGAFVFSWTDEWFRAGSDVDDWEFGLTRRDRSAKPALLAAQKVFSEVPFPRDLKWPRISVVVCSYNGSATIQHCMEAILKLRYQNFEVIVIDDGSTDNTSDIVANYPVRLFKTTNQGLSAARNLGWQAATGEIVAYIDDDAYPDRDWLTYMASVFETTGFVGVGGPNIHPEGDGLVAECVANSPGGPTHVLLSDREAEHIPGCNMAFRRTALEAVGGFNPIFRVAGDDVDICWRLQKQGWKLGFAPAAQVWHHSRNSVLRFWKQQKGYGRAEALLEKTWPEKYNIAGHPTWAGRIYSDSVPRIFGCASRIYFGEWGTAPFQSLYQSSPRTLQAICLTPEWYLVNLLLVVLSCLGMLWRPLLLVAPLLAITVSLPLLSIGATVGRIQFGRRRKRMRVRILTTFLHVIQPLGRLYGRIENGLTLWRERAPSEVVWPVSQRIAVWTPQWQAPATRLESVETLLRANRKLVRRGDSYDAWDLHVCGGLLGGARMRMVCEDGNKGHQYVRYQLSPRYSFVAGALVLVMASAAFAAALDGVWFVGALLAAGAAILAMAMIRQSGGAMAAAIGALRPQMEEAAARCITPARTQTAQPESNTAGAAI
jgi:GT2 family glycosyltransferase